MNVWIVYDSKFGNNKRIAEALAGYFKDGNEVHVHHAKETSPKEIMNAGVDVFLFGGPLRAGNISFTMKSFANGLAGMLKKKSIKVKIAAVWGSHSTNSPETPSQFSWATSKQKWKALLDAFPAEKKAPDVFGFDVIPTTLEGPLEPGWEATVKQLADTVKGL